MDEEKFRDLVNKNKNNSEFIKELEKLKSSDDLIAFLKKHGISIENYELDKVLSTIKYFILERKSKSMLDEKDLDISGGIDHGLLEIFKSLDVD